MGRPPRHDTDRLLDAAMSLAATSGPGSVTIAAVARVAGAPSGSIYHRFPSRAALLAALWLRTAERFQKGFLSMLDGDRPGPAAVAAARHVVAWSRANPDETRILLYGPADFDEPDWPADARAELKQRNRAIFKALRSVAERMGAATAPDIERLHLATVDLPYATVRRHAAVGTPIPAYAEDLVAQCVAALLATPPGPEQVLPQSG